MTKYKEFTQEMLDALKKANDSVVGTREYMKYQMECSAKRENRNSWFHVSWSIPYRTGRFKAVRGVLYIYCDDIRYCVSEEVMNVIADVVGKEG